VNKTQPSLITHEIGFDLSSKR